MSIDPAMLRKIGWRTPAVILVCGCLIDISGSGRVRRSACSSRRCRRAHGWGRDVFALALAMQMLLWGAGQPFAGAIADRFGAVWVLAAGAVLYAIGLV